MGSTYLNLTRDGWIDFSSIPVPVSGEDTYEWENIDLKRWGPFAERNYHYPLIISGIYFVLVFGIKIAMRNKKPYDLRLPLFLWNAGLGVFSILAFSRLLPMVIERFHEDGFHASLCVYKPVSSIGIFWGAMFVASKIVELGDTLFIVLRKKPLKFLQWYHHAMSLTLAWQTGYYQEPQSPIYVVMNYGVHSLMYPYFALRARDVHIPRKLANVITLLQLVQMLIGVGVNSYTSWMFLNNSCDRHPYSIKMVWIAYGSFAILFGNLFYDLVLQKQRKKIE